MRVSPAAFALSATLAFGASGIGAHEVETATVLVCDTQKQAERLVELAAKDPDHALEVVNAEAKDPTACAFANIAFVRGDRIAGQSAAPAPFTIVRVIALGTHTPRGVRPIAPSPYFMLTPVAELKV